MISDFGLSKIHVEGSTMKTACGTPGYVGKLWFQIMLYKITINIKKQWAGYKNNTVMLIIKENFLCLKKSLKLNLMNNNVEFFKL